MINVYDVGDVAHLTVSYDELPDSVTLTINPPTGPRVKYSLESPETTVKSGDTAGSYYADIEVTVKGRWYWEWNSTGAQAAAKGEFHGYETFAPEPEA